MIGISAVIFLFIPESPWWLTSKDNPDKAAVILQKYYGHAEGYDVQEQIVRIPLLLKFLIITNVPALTGIIYRMS